MKMPLFQRAALLVLLGALTLGAGAAQAQGTNVAFGSLKGDPTQPVEVTADQLQVNQGNAQATFTGNVIVVQGPMRLTAPEVRVNYTADGKAISEVFATGGVTLTNGAEAAEGDEALYTLDTGLVVMTGNVLLTQGASAITGTELTVDLNAGTGLMQGRVQTVFVPGQTP
jgi:lipopolysaccharide export system protein LptA